MIQCALTGGDLWTVISVKYYLEMNDQVIFLGPWIKKIFLDKNYTVKKLFSKNLQNFFTVSIRKAYKIQTEIYNQK